jgi:glycosyltransferase 2 family protein
MAKEGMKRFKRASILLRCLIGFGLLIVVFSIIDITKITAAISKADPKYIAIGILPVIANRFVYAWQLGATLQHHQVPSTFTRAFIVNTIAGFYSIFIPGGAAASAVMKWYRLSQTNVKKTEVFAAILFLRLVNTIVIFAFGFFALIVENPLDLKFGLWLIPAIVGGLALLFFLISRIVRTRGPEICQKFFPEGAIEGLLEKVRKLMIALSHSSRLSGRLALLIVATPALGQILSALVFYAVACGLQLQLSFVTLIWIVSMVYFIQMIPASLSGLGLREGALVFLLPYYGIEPASSLAFSLLSFSYHLFMGFLGGALEIREILVGPTGLPAGADKSKDAKKSS